MIFKNAARLTAVLLTAGAFAYAEEPPPAVKQHGCENCHRFEERADPPPNKAPDLFYAGDKFQKNWLKTFLQNPEVIRKAGYYNDPGFLLGKPVLSQPHIALPPEDANAIGDYLSTLKLPGLEGEAVDPEPLSKERQTEARIAFERNFGCSVCHQTITLAQKERGGISGPSLVNAGNRLQANWAFHWLKNPKKFQAKGRMPIYDLEDEDAILIAKYLMTLKKENLR